jgi:hypothetical protein
VTAFQDRGSGADQFAAAFAGFQGGVYSDDQFQRTAR